MYLDTALSLVYKVLCRCAQLLRTTRLLDPNVGTLDACIEAGPAWLATTAANLPNLTSVACFLGYTCSGGHLCGCQVTGVAQTSLIECMTKRNRKVLWEKLNGDGLSVEPKLSQ